MRDKKSDPLEIQKGGLFEVVLNAVKDGVTILDLDLGIVFQNQIIKQKYGRAKKGTLCHQFYHGRDSPCEQCKILDVLSDGVPRRIARDITLPNGEVMLLEVESTAIRDNEGNIIGGIEIARDVTDQKKVEALFNKTLLKQNEALNRLHGELSDAEGYVKSVLPEPIPSGPVLADWRFIPSASLGGDSFGYHWIDDDHFAIYLLDVSGHGWAAALLSVSVINVLRSHALPDTNFLDPPRVLTTLNNIFPGEKNNDMFFTIWYGVYHAPTRSLAYASGGHPPVLLTSESPPGRIQATRLRTPNFVIGGRPDISYRGDVQEIHRPARLYVFSDGVYDITRADGSIWGLNDFLEFIVERSSEGRFDLDRLVRHARELSREEPFDDDFTILEVVFP